MASDNENTPINDTPPQEFAPEKIAAPPAREATAEKTDEAARPHRHPRGDHRPHRDKADRNDSPKADAPPPAPVGPAAVARTFGALPMRIAKPAYTQERQVAFPPKALSLSYTIPTDTPRGVVELAWPATDARDVPRTRRLRLLTSVLQDRLRVKLREEMGDTYSPSVGLDLTMAFTGYGYLSASAIVAPASARVVADAIRAAAADLARHGVTEEEFHRAQAPILTGLRQSARDNQYWRVVLANAQEEPRQLEWVRTRLADYESMTAADLKSLAAQYFDPERASEIISVPATTGAAKQNRAGSVSLNRPEVYKH